MSRFIALLSLAFSMTAAAKDVMLINRIGPSNSELWYVANSGGFGEHELLPPIALTITHLIPAGRRSVVLER